MTSVAPTGPGAPPGPEQGPETHLAGRGVGMTRAGPSLGPQGPAAGLRVGSLGRGLVFLCPVEWKSQGIWFVSHQQGQEWEGSF